MELKPFGREIIFEEFQPMRSRYLIVMEWTDVQTDGLHAMMQSHNRALRSIAR